MSPHCFGWTVLGKVLCSNYGTMWISGGCVIIGHSLPAVVTLGYRDRSPAEQILPTG